MERDLKVTTVIPVSMNLDWNRFPVLDFGLLLEAPLLFDECMATVLG